MIAGWGLILVGLFVLGQGTQRVLESLDGPLLGAGVAPAAACSWRFAPHRPVLLALAFFLSGR